MIDTIMIIIFIYTGARTPSYGGFMTPSHDPSQTPQHSGGSAWDPSVANTPARYITYSLCYITNIHCITWLSIYKVSYWCRVDEWGYGYDNSTPSPAVSEE